MFISILRDSGLWSVGSILFLSLDWGPSTTPGRTLRAWIFPRPSLAASPISTVTLANLEVRTAESLHQGTRSLVCSSHLNEDPIPGGETEAGWGLGPPHPVPPQRLPGYPLSYPEFHKTFDHVTPVSSNHSHCNTRVNVASERFMLSIYLFL